jgi:hypothetical protein
MTFLTKLKELEAKATDGPWFNRYCDDDNHQCMTVISSKDYGPTNTGQFKDEPDTVAITFHQLMPSVGDNADCNDANTELIAYLRNHAKEIINLVEAAEVINNRREDIFQHDADFIALSEVLAALNKEPIDPNKWAFDKGLESY